MKIMYRPDFSARFSPHTASAQWAPLAKARNFANYALISNHAPNHIFSSKMSHTCTCSTLLVKIETFKGKEIDNTDDCLSH